MKDMRELAHALVHLEHIVQQLRRRLRRRDGLGWRGRRRALRVPRRQARLRPLRDGAAAADPLGEVGRAASVRVVAELEGCVGRGVAAEPPEAVRVQLLRE